jgi:hypothetical protein
LALRLGVRELLLEPLALRIKGKDRDSSLRRP